MNKDSKLGIKPEQSSKRGLKEIIGKIFAALNAMYGEGLGHRNILKEIL
ncbi:MAG: hypothetical protein ACFFD2_15500 [Promethearchaeota archaeon]